MCKFYVFILHQLIVYKMLFTKATQSVLMRMLYHKESEQQCLTGVVEKAVGSHFPIIKHKSTEEQQDKITQQMYSSVVVNRLDCLCGSMRKDCVRNPETVCTADQKRVNVNDCLVDWFAGVIIVVVEILWKPQNPVLIRFLCHLWQFRYQVYSQIASSGGNYHFRGILFDGYMIIMQNNVPWLSILKGHEKRLS